MAISQTPCEIRQLGQAAQSAAVGADFGAGVCAPAGSTERSSVPQNASTQIGVDRINASPSVTGLPLLPCPFQAGALRDIPGRLDRLGLVPSLPRAVASTAIVFILIASVARAGQVVTAGSAGSSGDASSDLPFCVRWATDSRRAGRDLAGRRGACDGASRAIVGAAQARWAAGRSGLRDTPSITDFFQQEPVEGDGATEKTEVWMLFDDDTFYVTFRCWESQPERWSPTRCGATASTSCRTTTSRSCSTRSTTGATASIFEVNTIGGRSDGQVTNERQFNSDWNPIWDLRVGRFDGGWTVEVAIPFKSLRYRPGRAQVWGFNARRVERCGRTRPRTSRASRPR